MGVVKTWNGIARASLKTWDGIASASVKTINGFDATTGGTTYSLQETIGAVTTQFATKLASTASVRYFSSSHSPASNFTLTKLEIYLLRFTAGGSAGDLFAEVRSDSSGTPGSVVATSTNTLVSADISDSTPAYYGFLFTGASLTSGTPYWFTIKSSVISAAENYALYTGVSGVGAIYRSDDGSTWTSTSTRKAGMKLYISP